MSAEKSVIGESTFNGRSRGNNSSLLDDEKSAEDTPRRQGVRSGREEVTQYLLKIGDCLATKGSPATMPRKRPGRAGTQVDVAQMIRAISDFPSWEQARPESDN